ncbi:MAG: hypothetical protein MJZ27_10340 [Bacteroidales bacterium]|nr:hypothetical protein [Bacteroidales bacterium]
MRTKADKSGRKRTKADSEENGHRNFASLNSTSVDGDFDFDVDFDVDDYLLTIN